MGICEEGRGGCFLFVSFSENKRKCARVSKRQKGCGEIVLSVLYPFYYRMTTGCVRSCT